MRDRRDDDARKIEEQEKHDELFWSEIEDGICPPRPSRRGIVTSEGVKWLPDTAPLEDRLKQVSEVYKK
jgi:hypothetical protein